ASRRWRMEASATASTRIARRRMKSCRSTTDGGRLMCELLVRGVDKTNHDCPYLDAQCLKRGDVVVAVEDGWQWGRAEIENLDWRIVRLPGVSLKQAQTLLGPEMNADP